MQEFQKRVVAEKEQLDLKIEALCLFSDNRIYYELPITERARMTAQLNAMIIYSGVLGLRIAAFE